MKIVKTSDFDSFRCLADKCTDTCCTGWEIDVDEASLERFEHLDEPIRERLYQAIDFNRGIIKYNDKGVCALLREDGLCSLVCDYGEDILCEICHMYPRHVEEYDGVREWSLALSCPEAARMAINCEEISFLVEENDEEEPYAEDFEDFDYMLYTQLEDSREVIYTILNSKDLYILKALGIVLTYTKELQDCIESNELFRMQDVTDKYRESYLDIEPCNEFAFDKLDVLYSYISENIDVLHTLECLRDSWQDKLDDIEKSLLEGKGYFKESFCMNERAVRNIAVILIYTYYLGAVYDDYLYPKAAMSVYISIMMAYATSVFGMENIISVVSSMAREIEHSDDNLNAIEEYFYKDV